MTHKDMSPDEIRARLKAAGITQAGIARDLGLRDCTISLVINKNTASDRVRRHISRCIGEPVEAIWPETYLVKQNDGKVGHPKTRGLYDQ